MINRSIETVEEREYLRGGESEGERKGESEQGRERGREMY
jgi:hypothetical protein